MSRKKISDMNKKLLITAGFLELIAGVLMLITSDMDMVEIIKCGALAAGGLCLLATGFQLKKE